jgi:hypothetical protein
VYGEARARFGGGHRARAARCEDSRIASLCDAERLGGALAQRRVGLVERLRQREDADPSAVVGSTGGRGYRASLEPSEERERMGRRIVRAARSRTLARQRRRDRGGPRRGGCGGHARAAASGAQTLALERAGGGGGTSAMSGGVLYLGGGTALQRACGFEDSADEMFKYLMASVALTPTRRRSGVYCDGSVEHYDVARRAGRSVQARLLRGL